MDQIGANVTVAQLIGGLRHSLSYTARKCQAARRLSHRQGRDCLVKNWREFSVFAG
jgi:hypothetical protein